MRRARPFSSPHFGQRGIQKDEAAVFRRGVEHHRASMKTVLGGDAV